MCLLGGSWAGVVYTSDGCPGDCIGESLIDRDREFYLAVRLLDYVNNNPSAFTNAYWDVAGVRVYQ